MSRTKESQADQQQFWQMVIETWRSSGLGVRQFCRQEGLSEPAFYSWRRRLSGDDSQRSRQEGSSPSPFVQVSIPQNSFVLELVLSSGNTLRINSVADNKTIILLLQRHLALGNTVFESKF